MNQTLSDPALTRVRRFAGRVLPMLLALAVVAGVTFLGYRSNWRLTSFSELIGRHQAADKDWCDEHAVPESICVECRKDCFPRAREHGWCKLHGVSECPHCHPDVAQLPAPPRVTDADLERARAALALLPRTENSSKCTLHQRVIQLASDRAAEKIGLAVAPTARGRVSEAVTAHGEVTFDPTRTHRVAARVPGAVWRLEKAVGDWVNAGDVLALIDAAEVGKAKSDFLQALAQVDVKEKALAALRASPATSTGQAMSEAAVAVEEAKVRLTAAQQALLNLGMSADFDALNSLPADKLARRVRFLGLPDAITKTLNASAPGTLIAVTAPAAGVVAARDPVAGEPVDLNKVLFVVADNRYMTLTLDVRLEDARRLRPGQTVRFRPDGGDEVVGQLAWLSTAVDESTRTVKARAELPNPGGRLRDRTFGGGRVVLREDPAAIVVPGAAVHWEGDCHVVFVRDRDYDAPGAKKVFHVRKVRPGAAAGEAVEIIAGVLPGELVATDGSGILRGELLKNRLGEG